MIYARFHCKSHRITLRSLLPGLLGKAPSELPAGAKVEALVASEGPAQEEAVAEGLPDPSAGGFEEVDPVTPPPKPPVSPKEFSEPKFKHWTYKSKRVGFFCRDCKMSSHDPSAFRTRPCLPDEWKTSPQDAEDEVNSPAEGEEKFVQEQLFEAQQLQEKLQLLKDLKEEEARLEELFRLKSSGTETDIVETIVGESGVENNQEGEHGMGSNGVDLNNYNMDVDIDNWDTLPYDARLAAAETSLGLSRVTPEEKVMQEAEVEKDYERDMESFELNHMSRHDKDFFDPFAKNFKCGKVVAVVGNTPEPVEEFEDTHVEEKTSNPTVTPEETQVETHAKTDPVPVPESAKQSFAELASMCAELQQSAGPCNEKMSALVGKLKRSLDDFMKVGVAPTTPGEKEDVGEGGAHATEKIDTTKRQKVESKETERPAAVLKAQFVSPKMQTKMTKSKCNDEVGEEDEAEEKEEEVDDDDDDDDDEGKPRRRTKKPKAKAKSRPKAKAKAKSKPSKAAGSKDSASKRKAAVGTQETAKRSKKGSAEKRSGGAMAGGKEICEFCEAQKKKLRSFQSSSYHVAKKKALDEGLDANKAAELGKKVS